MCLLLEEHLRKHYNLIFISSYVLVVSVDLFIFHWRSWLTFDPSPSECLCLAHRLFAEVSFFFVQVGDCWSPLAQHPAEWNGGKKKTKTIRVYTNPSRLHFENSSQICEAITMVWSIVIICTMSCQPLNCQESECLRNKPRTTYHFLTKWLMGDQQECRNSVAKLLLTIANTRFYLTGSHFPWKANFSCFSLLLDTASPWKQLLASTPVS